jgi:hypothetical protein
VLGACGRYWNLPDCIYRRLPDGTWLVGGEADLWREPHALEAPVIDRLAAWLVGDLGAGDCLVSPMAIGSHVDHHLSRAGAELAAHQVGCKLRYYPDYPYVAKQPGSLGAALQPEWREVCREVSHDGLVAWQEAIARYVSQVSTFWPDRAALDTAMASYWIGGGGACLWERANEPKPLYSK